MTIIEKITPGNGFKLSIPVKKFLIGLGFTLILTAITYTINYVEGGDLSLTHAFATGLGLSTLSAVKNAVNHYKDKVTNDIENK